jgi:uncharacterized protein YoxC
MDNLCLNLIMLLRDWLKNINFMIIGILIIIILIFWIIADIKKEIKELSKSLHGCENIK